MVAGGGRQALQYFESLHLTMQVAAKRNPCLKDVFIDRQLGRPLDIYMHIYKIHMYLHINIYEII